MSFQVSINGSNFIKWDGTLEKLRSIVLVTRDREAENEVTVLDTNGKRVWWRKPKRVGLNQKITQRGEYARQIEFYRVGDKVWAQTGGRDCDMCKSTTAPFLTEANAFQWERLIDRLWESAEGPVWYWLMSAADAAEASGSFEDLALQAYEDGHPHYVID